MYIADESVVISLDDLRYVAREDGNEILKLCYPEKTHALEFYTAEDRDAMFDFLVKRLVMDDRFIVPMPGKAEQIDKEKIGYLIEKALMAAYENGEASARFADCKGLGKHKEYPNAQTTARKCSAAVEELYKALGTEREYLQKEVKE